LQHGKQSHQQRDERFVVHENYRLASTTTTIPANKISVSTPAPIKMPTLLFRFARMGFARMGFVGIGVVGIGVAWVGALDLGDCFEFVPFSIGFNKGDEPPGLVF